MWTDPEQPGHLALPTSLDGLVKVFEERADLARTQSACLSRQKLPVLFAGMLPLVFFVLIAGGLAAITRVAFDPAMLGFKTAPPSQEWFAARSVPCAASRVTMVDKWCRFAVWDVTSTYAKIATRIIQNMNSVAHSFRCGVCSSQRDSFVARPLRAYVLYWCFGLDS